jgi:signal recognition particle GTPase
MEDAPALVYMRDMEFSIRAVLQALTGVMQTPTRDSLNLLQEALMRFEGAYAKSLALHADLRNAVLSRAQTLAPTLPADSSDIPRISPMQIVENGIDYSELAALLVETAGAERLRNSLMECIQNIEE